MITNLFREEIIDGQVKDNYENLIDSFIYIITFNADNYRPEWLPKDFDAIDLFSQKLLHHIISTNTLVHKSSFQSKLLEDQLIFFDPTSVFTLIRSQFETYLAFNHLFINSLSDEEQLITRFSLWILCGVKSKHKLNWDETEKNKKDLEIGNETITAATEDIKSTELFKNLSDTNKRKFFEAKNFQVIIENNTLKYVSWEEMSQRAGISEDFLQLYNMLSINAHPTYPSLLQIRDMHKNTMHIDLVKIGIGFVQFLIAFMIRDYCDSSSSALEKFKEIPEEYQALINHYNEVGRNKKHI